MRAGEIRQLNLDDIDWIEGVIHVRASKSRRERTLPLLAEVGKVLSLYLRKERPQSVARSIFLTTVPPYRPLAWSARLSEMTCFQRAQVKFDSTTYLQLHGKGRKERIVPLWAKTGRVLRSWFRELEGEAPDLAFPSFPVQPL